MAERKKYVFDTSSLSHAFEDFVHSIGSAAKYCIQKGIKPESCNLHELVSRRADSTRDTRKLIMQCIENICLVPHQILDELMKNPQMRDEAILLFYGRDVEIKRRYGFSIKNFKLPKLFDVAVSEDAVRKVKSVVITEKLRLTEQDIFAIALAMSQNATLVTADSGMCKLARKLNIDVICTL